MTDEFTPKERRMLETWIAVEPPGNFADRVLSLQPHTRRWLPYAIAAAASGVAAAAILLLVLRPQTIAEKAPPTALSQAPDASVVGVEPPVIDGGITALAPDDYAPDGDPYDVAIEVGQTATIHDPLGKTTINFVTPPACKSGMQVEIDLDPTFRRRRANQGVFGVVLALEAGAWSYRASCMSGGMPEAPFASGRIVVVHDAGRRSLPRTPGSVAIQADGRTWRVSYQATVPDITIDRPPGGEQLHLSSAKGPQVIDVKRAAGGRVGLSNLEEGTYTYWFTRGGVTMGEVSTLVIDFDQTAPQIFLDTPRDNDPLKATLDVRGTTVPGWAVSFEQSKIRSDPQHRFLARVSLRPGSNSIAVRFDHPQRGTHFFVRRLR